MEYGEARATIDGDTVTTIVVFGEDEAPPCWGRTLWKGWPWLWTRRHNGWSPLP